MFPSTSSVHAVHGGGGNRTRDTFPHKRLVDPELAAIEAAIEAEYGPIKPYKPRNLGYVYFIQAETGGPIKIGWARDVPKRLSQLQVSQPYPLVVLGTIRCGQKREVEIHKRFADDRLQGEWFETSPRLIRFIEKESS